MTRIQVNITLSTLLVFNLLVAIRENCKQTTQFPHFAILIMHRVRMFKSDIQIIDRVEY